MNIQLFLVDSKFVLGDLTTRCTCRRKSLECQTLKDKIEELIQARHLRKFVQLNNKNSNRSPQRREKYPKRDERKEYYPRWHHDDDRRLEDQPQTSEPSRRDEHSRRSGREMINTITGDFSCKGCSSSARKKHLRAIKLVNSTSAIARPRMPPILFANDDFKVIDPT